MKRRLFLTLLGLSLGVAFGQQDKQFTHYMFDRMSYNPAATGFKGYCGTLIYRNQWDRVQDAPNTTLFNVQGNLQGLYVGPGKLGVGLSFHNDAIGFQRNNTLTFNGAYHVQTVFGILSAGVGVGLINVGFNPNWVPPQVPVQFDPSIVSQKLSAFGFDQNFGLYWHYKGAHVGVSSTHIVPADLTKVNYSVARHYYIQAGYKYQLPLNNGNPIYLNPGILIKADGATSVFDLNLMADIWLNTDTYVWGGATYRLSDAVAVMAGFGKDNFKVGYSFDIMTNPLNEHGKGTHELMVSYCIFPPAPTITRWGLPNILQ